MNSPPQADAFAALEADLEFFNKSGPLPTAFDEDRRYPRFYYRARVQAAVYPAGGGNQPPAQCSVLTRDLSRGGMNLIHNEQVFPGQRIELVLTDGSPRSVEVMWCRRIAHRCYSIGCRFIKTAEETVRSEPSVNEQTPVSDSRPADSSRGDVA
jgi:hypothetical protein